MVQFTKTTVSVPSSTANWNLSTQIYTPLSKEPVPVVIMAHGFGANKKMTLPAYAEAFAKAGYACITFDYRRWGKSDGSPRYVLDVNEQLEDYHTVVKYARQHTTFDPHKVVVWGTSFSGAYAITLAGDNSINACAAIAQCPYTGGGAPPTISLGFFWSLFLSFVDIVKLKLGLEPIYIPATAQPGEVGALTQPGSVEGMISVCDTPSDYPNVCSASCLLRIAAYKPRARVAHITCPLLIVAPTHDNLCSFEGMKEVAAQASKGEILELDGDHFSAYPGHIHYTESLQGQLEFLARHVPV